MTGLGPVIHGFLPRAEDVDPRVKPGNDGGWVGMTGAG